jgi:phage terminase small subunit
MPVLSNAKHELFAQLLAKGRGQAEAYAEAGYTPSEPNASRLTSNDKVAARVAEIQGRAAIRTEITVAAITERLMRLADMAEKTGAVKDQATGEVMETSPKHLAIVRTSLMDAAKLNGLIIDKAEVKTILSPEERQARIAALMDKARHADAG